MTTLPSPAGGRALGALVLLCAALFSAWVLKHLSYPLLWNDEAETAMYGERILDFGYPKVHDGRNLVYELQGKLDVGLKKGLDAYIGSTWGQYYVGALGAFAARRVSDPYDKTLLLRAPFALAGLAGVFAFAALGASLFPSDRRHGLAFALGFLLLAPLSTVLVVHLREMRHYPLVILLVACALWTYVHFHVLGRGRYAVHCALLATLLALLFQVFSLPYAALATTLGLDQLARFARGRDFGRAGLTGLARGLLPLALSAAVVVPTAVFFETLRVASQLAAAVRAGGIELGLPARCWLILFYLSTQELLLPAAAAKLASLAAARATRGEALGPAHDARRRASGLLWLFVLVYVGIAAAMPFSYERYLVVLSPVLVLLLLLDGSAVVELVRRRVAPDRRRRVTPIAGLAALALALLIVPGRWPALRGHWREITVQYRGPLDFAVAALRARYPRPESLVIATNYEPSALMYYLGSRVTVGFACANLAEDLAIQPDVIIERPWRRCRRPLELLAQRAAYEPERLPVANLRYNNVPQIGPSPFVPGVHRFETPLPGRDGEALVLLHRRADLTPGAGERAE